MKTITVATRGLRHRHGHRVAQQVGIPLQPVHVGLRPRTCHHRVLAMRRKDSTTTFSLGDRLEDRGVPQDNLKTAVLMVVPQALFGHRSI